jgi:hypothetical protein
MQFVGSGINFFQIENDSQTRNLNFIFGWGNEVVYFDTP